MWLLKILFMNFVFHLSSFSLLRYALLLRLKCRQFSMAFIREMNDVAEIQQYSSFFPNPIKYQGVKRISSSKRYRSIVLICRTSHYGREIKILIHILYKLIKCTLYTFSFHNSSNLNFFLESRSLDRLLKIVPYVYFK